MTDDRQNSDLDDLDMLLDGLKDEPPAVSKALLGRVLDDAYALQPALEDAQSSKSPRRRWEFLSVIGGWGGLGGLAVAASVGFFIGFNPPAVLENSLPFLAAGDLFEVDTEVGGFGWDLEEDAAS